MQTMLRKLNKIRHPGWLVLILMPLLLLWRIVFAGRVLFWGVPLLQFYPWQQFAAEMWRSGQAPLWNPFVGNGAPLAANLQSAVFYPLNFLYLILPAEQAMGYTAVLHVVLAGLAMYAWGRALGLQPLSALIAALAFQFSQFFIARLGFLSITATFPWTAVWLWRAEVLAQRRCLSDAAWLALAIGLGLLAGHAQTAGLGLVVMVLYALVRMLQEARRRTQDAGRRTQDARGRRQEAGGRTQDAGGAGKRHAERAGDRLWSAVGGLPSAVGGLLSAVILGFALAAIQLLPALELTAQSQRATGLDYQLAVAHSLHPLRLLTFLAPDLMGQPAEGSFWGYDNYWENAGYVGVWALLMAGLAVSSLKSQMSNVKAVTWFFAGAAGVSLLIALGRFTPFYGWLFRAAPVATLFQGPARLLSVYTLAVCALAGIGTEQLLEGRHLPVPGRALLVAGAGVLLAALAGTTLAHVPAVLVRPVLQFGVTLCACAACLAFHPSFPMTSRGADGRFRWWGVMLVGVVAADLLVSDGRLNPTTDPSVYRSPTQSARAIRTGGSGRVWWFAQDEETVKFGRYLSFQTFGPAEAAYWMGLRETLLPNTAMIERVPSASNFDSLVPGRYNELMRLLNTLPKPDALRVAGVMDARYIVSPSALPLPIEQRGADVTVYRNDAALGRAWIVPQARIAHDALSALADPAFDARRTVLIEPADAGALPRLDYPDGRSSVTLRDSSNAVTILAETDSGGWLVLADTFYPGWQATLDGATVKIWRANHAFRAVALPPGRHTVVFRYAPLTFRVGALVSLMALMVTVGALGVSSLGRVRM